MPMNSRAVAVIRTTLLLVGIYFLSAFVAGRMTRTRPPPPSTRPVAIADPGAGMNWGQLMDASRQSLKRNRLDDSIRLCDEALKMAGTFGPNDTRFSYSQVLRAEIYLFERKKDLAEQTFKDAVASCEKAAGPDSPALVHPLSSMANYYYFFAHQNDQVAAIFERILKIVQDAPHRDIHDVSMWTRNLGKIYQEQKKFAEAEPLFQQDIALAEKIDPDWLAVELLTQADFYRAWGKYDRAELATNRAIALREAKLKGLGPDGDVLDAQLDVSICLDNLGQTCLAWGHLEQAEAAYRRSLAIGEKYLNPDQSDLRPRLLGLADTLRAERKYDQAEPLYKRALDNVKKSLGIDSIEAADILDKYAALLNDMQRPDEAKSQSDLAARIRKFLAAQPK